VAARFGIGAYRDAPQIRVADFRVLPGAGQHAIVPVDVVGVVPQLTLLDVLLYGSVLLLLQAAQWIP